MKRTNTTTVIEHEYTTTSAVYTLHVPATTENHGPHGYNLCPWITRQEVAYEEGGSMEGMGVTPYLKEPVMLHHPQDPTLLPEGFNPDDVDLVQQIITVAEDYTKHITEMMGDDDGSF